MQVSVEATNGLERRMTVNLPAADINSEISQRLNKARNTVAINGFRKGKVPMSVLQQRFGAGVRQEVLGELINKSYGEALDQEKVRPAGQPAIEPVEGQDESNGFSYTAVFDVFPTVELTDITKFEFEQAECEINDADVDEMLESLRKQNISWAVVDRPAQDDDTVIIDFIGTVDGEEFEGGSAKGSNLVLGSGSMIPGFETGIIGMKSGESRNVEVTFPEDYQTEDLQGKNAVFAITLNEVKEGALPEVNDEFIAKFAGEDADMEAFRTMIRENMDRELSNKTLSYVKNQVMSSLAESHEFDLPRSMVKEEVARTKQEMFKQYGGGQDIDLSQFPDEPFREEAERKVKLGLVISELVSKEELSADEDAVKAEITKMASSYDSPEEVEQYYYSNQNLLNSIQMKVLEDTVVKHIVAQSKSTAASYTYAELMAKN